MHTLILPVGIPGSGKSTYVESLGPGTYVVSPDALKYENGVYVFTPERNAWTWATAYQMLGEWLRLVAKDPQNATEVCVFDATNLDPLKRAPLIHISRAFGVKVQAAYLNTPFEVCVERNNQRPPDRKVPMNVMERMRKTLVPPTTAEGFDEVTVRS